MKIERKYIDFGVDVAEWFIYIIAIRSVIKGQHSWLIKWLLIDLLMSEVNDASKEIGRSEYMAHIRSKKLSTTGTADSSKFEFGFH